MKYTFEFVVEVLKLNEEQSNKIIEFIKELNILSYDRKKYSCDYDFCNTVIKYIKDGKRMKRSPFKTIIEKYENILKILVEKEDIFKNLIFQTTFPNVKEYNNLNKLLQMLFSSDKKVILNNIYNLISLGFSSFNYIAESTTFEYVECGLLKDNSLTLNGIITDGKNDYNRIFDGSIEKRKIFYESDEYKLYKVTIEDFKYIIKYTKNSFKGVTELSIDINNFVFEKIPTFEEIYNIDICRQLGDEKTNIIDFLNLLAISSEKVFQMLNQMSKEIDFIAKREDCLKLLEQIKQLYISINTLFENVYNEYKNSNVLSDDDFVHRIKSRNLTNAEKMI